MEKSEAERLTPTYMAFVGDAVHTLFVRRRIVESGKAGSTLHVAASRFCNAKAQAEVFDALIERGALTDAEADIARRAKNAHLHSRTKTASAADYHKATALEAIVGDLYLAGDGRVDEILELCAELSGLNAYCAGNLT